MLLACALLAGVLAATIGAGYTVSRPLLDDAVAFVTKGTGLALVNAESRSIEAEALDLAPDKRDLEVVTLPDGQVYVVDNVRKRARKIDASIMEPGPEVEFDDGDASVVAAADGAYVVDGNRVFQLDADSRRGAPVELPTRSAGQIVPDAVEGVWVLTEDHAVTHVVGDAVRRTVPGDLRIEHLTVADERPVGLTGDGELLNLATDPPARVTETRVPHEQVLVGSAKGPGPWVLVLALDSGELVATDIRTGDTRTAGVRGRELGEPVQAHGFAYVPDYGDHVLHVVNIATGESLDDIEVPGRSNTFSLEVRAGRVWANDQFDRRAVVVTDGDDDQLVDKGDQPGLTDTHGPPDEPKDEPEEDPTEHGPPQRPDPGAAPPSGPVSQVEVPRIEPGTDVETACAQLGAAGLLCQPVPVGDGGEPGTVTDDPTEPTAGTRVPKGSTVTTRHYGPAAVPDVVGQYSDDACVQIESTGLDCRRQARDGVAPRPSDLDLVTSQDPGGGGEIPPGGEVTVVYFDKARMESYLGRVGTKACATIRRSYHQAVDCRTVVGRTEAQTGKPAGTVYEQVPAPGGTVSTRRPVTLTVVAPSQGVPDVFGQTPENACAILAAEPYSYTCDPRADAPPASRVVVTGQQPGAGAKLDPGGTVTIHYPGITPAYHALCRKSNGDFVFRMLANGCNVEFGNEKWDMGLAYPAGTPPYAGTIPLYEHYCTGTRQACKGFTQNRFYSRSSAPVYQEWSVSPGPTVLANCAQLPGGGDGDPADNLVPLYQVMYVDNSTGETVRKYTIRLTPNSPQPGIGPPAGSEFLGCIWAT
ncbi:PASTA domain-containing protein [Actinophytocola sp.]|uniref:PASTA domain-containing protein n=1 Tax=Actinophytocola sp. TaxID=1872138 RepID=UPI003D6B79ED